MRRETSSLTTLALVLNTDALKVHELNSYTAILLCI
jgi:hypothetical protein